MKLEDQHLQIDLTKNKNCPLLDFDIILRTNDEQTKYTSFDIYDYKKQKCIHTIKLNKKTVKSK